MSFDFSAYSEIELIQILGDAKGRMRAIITGVDFVSVTSAGKTFNKTILTAEDCNALIAAINAQLQRLNPTLYGTRVTRTTSSFRRCNDL